jgi:hypothetical protein
VGYPNIWTCSFYGMAFLVEMGITFFLGHVWYRATQKKKEEALQWRWSSEDSRDMWIDAAKTMITASGIAAALVTSLSIGLQNGLKPLVLLSVKVAVVNLIICVCVSMLLIVTLSRAHETAKARNIEKSRGDGLKGEIKEGPLSDFALALVLASSWMALSTFFFGFLFLGRIVVHI